MNRGGRSKASAITLCQKCLQRGHYSYECTVTTQQRPYKSRPSRTQQLLNPDLKPKLTTEVPNDLLRRKGVADELLAKKEEERAIKTSRSDGRPSRRRSPSVSSYSSDSVSTISTNRSRSRSPPPKAREENGKPASRGGQQKQKLGKRDRRAMSSGSDGSESSYEMRRSADRNTRRRMSSFSPAQRGRGRRRSRSRSRSRSDSRGARPRSHSSNVLKGKRPVRPASVSRSRSRSSHRMDTSDERSLPRNGHTRAGRSPRRESPPTRQFSTSRSRSRSPSPFSRRAPPRSPSPFRSRNGGRGRGGAYGGRGRGGPHNGGGRPFEDKRSEPSSRNGPPPPAPAPQKERSLSPYSKRVALTRQMQGGP